MWEEPRRKQNSFFCVCLRAVKHKICVSIDLCTPSLLLQATWFFPLTVRYHLHCPINKSINRRVTGRGCERFVCCWRKIRQWGVQIPKSPTLPVPEPMNASGYYFRFCSEPDFPTFYFRYTNFRLQACSQTLRWPRKVDQGHTKGGEFHGTEMKLPSTGL